MKLPSRLQWRQIFKILSFKEKITLLFLAAALIGSFSVLSYNFYLARTVTVPDPQGKYAEGEIGTVRFLNPVYAESSDVDRDITELLFSGLMKYDENGKIVTDLVQSYKISEDGKTYEFILKDNIFWSDGQKLTSDDVIYTIKTISDPAYKSPLRGRWLGVETEKISDTGLRLMLKNPYSSFLENCTTKIIPQHIWQNVTPENFPLSQFNLEPVGSGPYQLKKINRSKDGAITSVDLTRNTHYYGQKPNLAQFSFVLFDDYENLATGFKRGLVNGFALNFAPEANADGSFIGSTSYSFSFPRYFALFFNPETSKLLTDKKVRQALNYATDKQELLKTDLNGHGTVVESPILPGLYGFNAPEKPYAYNPDAARKLLDEAGFTADNSGVRAKSVDKKPAFQLAKDMKKGSSLDPDVKELQKCLAKEIDSALEASGYFGPQTVEAVKKFQEKYRADILTPNNIDAPTGDVLKTTRTKLNEICFPQVNETTPVKLVISTVDQPTMTSVANTLKNQWEKVGVSVEIKSYDIATLERDVIKPRNYDVLLFGEVLGAIPDPYPFWYSTQKIDPGLNLSLYENKDCDKLLKEARETLNPQTQKDRLEAFQNKLIDDAPAVFLYNPDYFYLTSGDVKGIKASVIVDPSKRFAGISNWFIKEKRVWK